jgi:outer membrane receptor protein involved in Fe transport
VTAGWLNTEFERLVINGVNRQGQAFPFSPEWTVGLGLAWKPETGWFGETSCNWADTCYSQVDSPVATKLEARTLLSARTGYRWKNVEAYVFGSNLLDVDYASSKTDFTSVGLPLSARLGMPRMLGTGVTLNW